MQESLHSNMFLLIRNMDTTLLPMSAFTFQYVSINTTLGSSGLGSSGFFTFQYVSINTQSYFLRKSNHSPLHSNMFLLIPSKATGKGNSSNSFTFQYVSINTNSLFIIIILLKTLHSNMFLLILDRSVYP